MSTNVKSSRVLRLSKTRFPSFSNPANLEGLSSQGSLQTSLTPQASQQGNERFEHSFTQAVSLKTLISENKPMYSMEPSIRVTSKIPKQVIELSGNNTRQASRDSSQTDINIAKTNSKPAYHKRNVNANAHDLSSITDKLNISNISKVSNVSNISFTRGSGLSERTNIDSERFGISTSVVFPTQSFNDFEENFASKPANGHKKSSRTSHGNSYREASSNIYQQNPAHHSSRLNSENMKHPNGAARSGTSTNNLNNTQSIKTSSLQKNETVPLCKVIDLTSVSSKEPSNAEKLFTMNHPILLERSFNKCEMSQISQLLKEQKDARYVKGSKENKNKPSSKGSSGKSTQNENENNKATSPKISVGNQKALKDNSRYQDNYSPNFEDSPVKVNQIRACKKPNANEKSKEDSVLKPSLKSEIKAVPVPLPDDSKSKRDKQMIKKQLLLKKNPLAYNKPHSFLGLEKQKANAQSSINLGKSDPNKNKVSNKKRKNFGEYLSDETVFRGLSDFLCMKTLCMISRVCKQLRTHDILALIKKAQCRLILKGLSEDEQYDFWDLHANFSFLQKTYPLQFAINGMKPSPFERDIMNDIDRTRFFNDTPISKQESLVRILLAVSNSVPKIGYVQGMNVLAALFLATKLKDSEVYWLLRYILNKKKFDDVLIDGFPRVQLLNYQLDIYARNYIPELVDYLADKGITLGYFATQWFITMFSYDLSFNHLTKIWNFFFIKGWKTMIRVALSLLWHFKDKICKQSMDDLPEFLHTCVKDHIGNISEEELFRVAFSFKISNRLLKGLETLYEHSAPTNVVLVPDSARHRLEWKIISENSVNQSSSMIQKDIIEYLNENLEAMKSINRLRGDGHNELANYRSVQIDLCNSSLLVDKSLNSATVRDKSHLDISTELRSASKPILSGVKLIKTNENNFFQTLTDFGKKIRQIWVTPKDDSLDVSHSSKLIGDKILSEQTAEKNTFRKGQPPLSERNMLTMSSSLLSKDLKTTTTDAEEFVESMNGKRNLANILKVSNERDLMNSVQPFNSMLFGNDDDQSFNFETRIATMSTSDLFDKVEKEILHAPKRALSKHRKNTSLTSESQNHIKSFKKPKMGNIGQSARNMNEKSQDRAEFPYLSIEKGFLPSDQSKQGWNVLGNKIKQNRESRENKPPKEMIKLEKPLGGK